ncbi:DUF3846 domain-containing protein [Plantactinospora sp. CA-290183]|uniref:DUF3846 domain-containing protein n=1 Tax=Plantactinospora sp. CA-290183 TaxID=3240006 RepID=UPI003D942590
MTHTPFVFIVVAEDGMSHEHHSRLRGGDVTTVLRRAVGGWPAPIPTGASNLHLWCDEDGPAKSRRPNLVAGLLVARLGGGRTPLAGPVAITGRRDGTAVSLTPAQIDAVLAALTHCR